MKVSLEAARAVIRTHAASLGEVDAVRGLAAVPMDDADAFAVAVLVETSIDADAVRRDDRVPAHLGLEWHGDWIEVPVTVEVIGKEYR